MRGITGGRAFEFNSDWQNDASNQIAKQVKDVWNGNGGPHQLSWKKAAVLTTMFWSASSFVQRFSGLVFGMHSGRSYPLTVAWSVLSTTCSLLAAQHGTNVLLPHLPNLDTNQYHNSLWHKATSWSFPASASSERRETIYQTVIGFISYGLLERRNFRTAIPSSVIATGVYAHTPLHWRWSRMREVVVASSDVATTAERARIQALGRLHGCHHCGSRQLFSFSSSRGLLPSRSRFIADHMPPTG